MNFMQMAGLLDLVGSAQADCSARLLSVCGAEEEMRTEDHKHERV